MPTRHIKLHPHPHFIPREHSLTGIYHFIPEELSPNKITSSGIRKGIEYESGLYCLSDTQLQFIVPLYKYLF